MTGTAPIRDKLPSRSTNPPKYTNYRRYKVQLRNDFNEVCGYCDASDSFSGGMRNYHIDHFAPKSTFPSLEVEYTNLIYSCPFCNIRKSNTWIGTEPKPSHNGTEGFIDPCDPAYDTHFERTANGKVIPLTQLGNFMFENLNLGLVRHQHIWQAKRLRSLRDEVRILIKEHSKNKDKSVKEYVALLEQYLKITELYDLSFEQVIA